MSKATELLGNINDTQESKIEENEQAETMPKLWYMAAICRGCKQATPRGLSDTNLVYNRLNRLQLKCVNQICIKVNGNLEKKYHYTSLANKWHFKNYVVNGEVLFYPLKKECQAICNAYNNAQTTLDQWGIQ